MKTSLVLILVLAVFVVLGIVAGVVHSQISGSSGDPFLKEDHTESPAAPPEENAAGYLANIVKFRQGVEQQMLLAERLRQAPAPASRTAYFQAILEQPGFRLAGWHLEVLEVKTAEGITTLRVQSTPLIIARQSVTVTGAMHETYEVHEGTLKLLVTEALTREVGFLCD